MRSVPLLRILVNRLLLGQVKSQNGDSKTHGTPSSEYHRLQTLLRAKLYTCYGSQREISVGNLRLRLIRHGECEVQ